MKPTPISSLLDVLYATHLSSYVQTPLLDRGGIFVVGPPGILKTSLLGAVERRYHDAVSLSDMNVQMWVRHLRDRFATSSYRTLILPEFQKLYDRNEAVAANLEGVIRCLVAEGFGYASFEDPNVARVVARATVIGAITSYLLERSYERWGRTGFARRFLFPLYVLDDPMVLSRALDDNRALVFSEIHAPPVPAEPIPNLTTAEERSRLNVMLKYQPAPHDLQKLLLVRVLSVLRWWYRLEKRPARAAWDTLEDFALLLGKEGGRVSVDENGR